MVLRYLYWQSLICCILLSRKIRVPQKFPVGHAANSTGDWLSIPHFAGDRQKLLCSSQSFQQLHLHVEMFLIGASEETVFRGFVFSWLLFHWKKNSSATAINAISASALLFGGVHLLNLGFLPLGNTLLQVITPLVLDSCLPQFTGKFRSLWGTILLHAVVDWLALCAEQLFQVKSASILSSSLSAIEVVITLLAGAGISLVTTWLLYRGKS